MKKKLKLSEEEILKINELYGQGKNAEQIRKALQLPMAAVRYHIERIILATINDPALTIIHRQTKAEKGQEAFKGKNYFQTLINELYAQNKTLLELVNGGARH